MRHTIEYIGQSIEAALDLIGELLGHPLLGNVITAALVYLLILSLALLVLPGNH